MAAANGNGTIPADQVPTDEIGTAVDHYDRVFDLNWSDNYFLPGRAGPRQIDEMLRVDGKAKSLEQVLTLPLRAVGHAIEPSEGDSGEAAWVREALTRPANAGGMSTPLELVIGQATSACLYRKAFFEKVFKVDPDGRVRYDKLAFRPAPTCSVKRNEVTGAFEGIRQRVGDKHPKRDDEGYVTIPPLRSFVFVYGQHRKPLTGISDLETAYALFETKQKIRFLWATFLENQVMPKAIAKDENGDDKAPGKLARKVATLKGGGVVGIGEGQSVTAFETSNSAAQAFADAIAFHDSEMTASVLAGFMDLTSAANSGTGSYALSKDSSTFFLKSRQAVLNELAASLVGWVIADLVRINFGNGASVPKFVFEPLVYEHIEQALELLKAIPAKGPSPYPQEFSDMLVVKTAGYLNLDQAVVAEAIKRRQEAAPNTPAAQLAAGVAAAEQMVREAGIGVQTASLSNIPAERDTLDLSRFTDRIEKAVRDRPEPKAPNVTVQAPQVNVHPPVVNVHPADVHVEPHITVERNGAMRVVHDGEGRVIGTEPKE